jgi:hypothetical protein
MDGDLLIHHEQVLRDEGFMAMGGQVVDASIVRAPVQRNRRDENEAIKAGEVPDDWKAKPCKRAQKDVDACGWRIANFGQNSRYFGFS